jgi:hypothetical protein
VRLGDPIDICEGTDGSWGYQVPVDITSDDGRVHIQQDASAYLGLSGGAWRQGWVEVLRDELQETATFAEVTGISGIDFEGIPEARWSAVQNFMGVRSPLAGDIIVETIVRGQAFELDHLTW